MDAGSHDFTVRFAETEEERLAAYRVRYAVSTEEEGDERYADHAARILRDRLDDGPSRVIIAETSSGIVGTSRVSFRRDGPFIADELYRWDLLAAAANDDQPVELSGVALWDRGAVLANFRRLGIYKVTEALVTETARRNSIQILVGVVDPKKEVLMAFMKRCGWAVFASSEIAGKEWFQVFKRPD